MKALYRLRKKIIIILLIKLTKISKGPPDLDQDLIQFPLDLEADLGQEIPRLIPIDRIKISKII